MKQCKGVCTIILFAIQILDATSVSNRTQDIPDVLSEGEQSFLNRIFHLYQFDSADCNSTEIQCSSGIFCNA